MKRSLLGSKQIALTNVFGYNLPASSCFHNMVLEAKRCFYMLPRSKNLTYLNFSLGSMLNSWKHVEAPKQVPPFFTFIQTVFTLKLVSIISFIPVFYIHISSGSMGAQGPRGPGAQAPLILGFEAPKLSIFWAMFNFSVFFASLHFL